MNTETQPLALTVREPEPLPVATVPESKAKTAQELRVIEVGEALLPAYQKAATCEMTEEEIAALMRRFPDSAIEIRTHDGLIYIPHIFISNRLNEVFKPGKWSLVRRRDWFDQTSSTMFGEYVLIVRGCYIGESVGGHPYIPTNPKQNLSDVLESTAAEALRRIAGKRLSCGSQVWEPEYARQWVEAYATKVNGKWTRKGQLPSQLDPEPPAEPKTRQQAKASDIVPKSPKVATDAIRKRMLEHISPLPNAIDYALARGFASLEEWPLDQVPVTKAGLDVIIREINNFKPAPPSTEEMPPDEIGNVVIHVPPAGMKLKEYNATERDTIGSLYRKAKEGDSNARTRLWGFVSQYEAVGYNGQPPTKEDLALRAGLDAFEKWWENKKFRQQSAPDNGPSMGQMTSFDYRDTDPN